MSRFSIYYFLPCLLLFFNCYASGNGTTEPIETDKAKQQPDATVSLAQKYTIGDLTTYRLIMENQRQAQWEGPESERPKSFLGGRTSNRTEITFDQLVQTIDNKGNAVLRIKITGLKNLSIMRDNVTLDFDGAKNNDPNSPLSKLLGRSYTIEMSPLGEVVRIIDANNVQTGFITASAENQTVARLLSSEAIKERHTIAALTAAARKKEHKTGESWSVTESTSFDLMGTMTYEKTYTLEEIIEEEGGRRIAVVRMNADAAPAQASIPLSFETNESYKGLLKLELTAGKILQNREEMATEWVIHEKSEQPVALRISATRLYSLEEIK